MLFDWISPLISGAESGVRIGVFDDSGRALDEVEGDLVGVEETRWFEWWKSGFLQRNITVRSCHVRYDLTGDLEGGSKGDLKIGFDVDLMSVEGDIMITSA